MYKTMLSYLKCRKNTGRKIQEFYGLKTEEEYFCVVYNDKKPKLIKEQEASGLLTSLEIKIPLNKIPLLGPFSF